MTDPSSPTTDRPPERLEGKTALITGGTSGIGLAVGRRFLDAGAKVVAVARHPSEHAERAGIRVVTADVADEAQVAIAFDRAVEEVGRLDAVVLNAGIADVDPPDLGSMDLAAVRRQFEVNTMGVLHGLVRAPAAMRDGGSITITATGALAWPFPGYLGYSISKAPLPTIAVHAAMALGSRGIRVNTVSPGTVLTQMQPADDPEARIASVATVLGRVATPEDVAGVFVFLASDDARYVTGTDLRVDGGWIGGLTPAEADVLLGSID
jgi:3alpha(or 20beta)-hydroxysteroid dehydrogenase